ncbi:polysaccharide deacetylase [Candidatus Vecturithrix granuli]|uniref:Polysaccharide deacetylase n=1 Tax=Vecturithrix granuli TaxID=1499967 RepID=A0A081C1G1_VECG1|nr:polysaccharide deacetylase [Candidatus Vecturithrix granuli]
MKQKMFLVYIVCCLSISLFGEAQQGLDESSFYAKSWAVVIGINEYPNFSSLDYAINDARAVEARFRRMGFEVIALHNDQATKQQILQVLKEELPQQIGRQDRLVIFYAGHGAAGILPSGEEVGFIIPYDGRSMLDGRYIEIIGGEILVDDYATFAERTNFISVDEIRAISDTIPAKHILYIIDGCYSGFLDPAVYAKLQPSQRIGKNLQTVGRGRGLSLEIDKDMRLPSPTPQEQLHPQNYLDVITARDTVQVLTAGSSGELVYEKSGHGVFTYYLLRALDGVADSDRDCVLMASELGTYLKQIVPQASNFSQSPLFNRISGEGEFMFIPPMCKPIDPIDMKAPLEDTSWTKVDAYKGPKAVPYKAPTQLAVDLEDQLYVLDAELSQIFKFDAAGNHVPDYGKSMGIGDTWKPNSMAVGYGGHLWVFYTQNDKKKKGDPVGGQIMIYDQEGKPLDRWEGQHLPITGCTRPDETLAAFPATGLLALDIEDNLIVLDQENGIITKCDRQGKLLHQWGQYEQHETIKNLNQYKIATRPQGLAVDMFGYVYIADTEGHGVQKFFDGEWIPSDIPNVKGNKPHFFDRPHGITVDNKLYLYIADTNNHRIKKYTSTGGKLLTFWGKKDAKKGNKYGEFNQPMDVALNWDNTFVYVADTGNKRVQRFLLK